MDRREERIVKNEIVFREVNEQVESLSGGSGAPRSFTAICECGSAACRESITIERASYQAIRAHPNRFIVRPTHAIEDVEDVVEDHDSWVVVAKKPGEPSELARATDPRR